jgi:hypothetical protein
VIVPATATALPAATDGGQENCGSATLSQAGTYVGCTFTGRTSAGVSFTGNATLIRCKFLNIQVGNSQGGSGRIQGICTAIDSEWRNCKGSLGGGICVHSGGGVSLGIGYFTRCLFERCGYYSGVFGADTSGGASSASGGALATKFDSELNCFDCRFSLNMMGAITFSSVLNIEGCDFCDNRGSGTKSVGCIYTLLAKSASISMRVCTFTNNSGTSSDMGDVLHCTVGVVFSAYDCHFETATTISSFIHFMNSSRVECSLGKCCFQNSEGPHIWCPTTVSFMITVTGRLCFSVNNAVSSTITFSDNSVDVVLKNCVECSISSSETSEADGNVAASTIAPASTVHIPPGLATASPAPPPNPTATATAIVPATASRSVIVPATATALPAATDGGQENCGSVNLTKAGTYVGCTFTDRTVSSLSFTGDVTLIRCKFIGILGGGKQGGSARIQGDITAIDSSWEKCEGGMGGGICIASSTSATIRVLGIFTRCIFEFCSGPTFAADSGDGGNAHGGSLGSKFHANLTCLECSFRWNDRGAISFSDVLCVSECEFLHNRGGSNGFGCFYTLRRHSATII